MISGWTWSSGARAVAIPARPRNKARPAIRSASRWQQSIRATTMTKDKRMTSHQRRLKWETIFLLDYFEKQRRLSPQDARIVCCLAVHALIEGEQEWDLGASMTMNRQCFEQSIREATIKTVTRATE